MSSIPKTKIGIAKVHKATSKSPYRTMTSASGSARNVPSVDSRSSKHGPKLNNYMSPVKEDKMRRYTGAVPIDLATTLPPQEVLHRVADVLQHLNVVYKKVSPFLFQMVFGFKCNKDDLKWQVELTQYEQADFLCVLQIHREKGDRKLFKRIMK